MTEAWQARAQVDITGEVCPLTYVRTKLKLETLAVGEVLEVRLKGEEPLRNVPRSAREEGHEVLALERAAGASGSQDEIWQLFIRKRTGSTRR